MKTHALTAAIALAATGCATLFSGPSTVPVATNPPGAAVYVNGMLAGQTPTAIPLHQGQTAHIQIYMPGYRPVDVWKPKSISGWFWLNLLVWPGFIVDLATGKYQKHDETPIMVGLVPEQGPPPEWYQPQPQPQPQPMPPGPAPVQPGNPNYPPPPPSY